MTDRAERRRDLWRSLSFGLLIVSFLAFRGVWRAGLALVLSSELGLAILTGLWVGGLAAVTIGISNVVVTGLILLAWRREQGEAV